jgi:hypothetical protein
VVDKSLGPINPGFRVPVIQPVKGGVGEIVLDDAALAAIERFRLRTVFSVGTQRTRSVYSEGAFLLGLKVNTHKAFVIFEADFYSTLFSCMSLLLWLFFMISI